MSSEDIFKKYLDMGWGVIPIGNDKKPLIKWKQYQTKKPSKEEMLGWYAQFDSADWALLLGHDNLVLVDCDDPNLYDVYLSGRFKGVVMRTPSSGISFLVKSTVVPKSITGLFGFALDIKGLDGLAIIPSIEYTPEQIKKEEKDELDPNHRIIRHWTNLGKPDEVEDIIKILKELLPDITAKNSKNNERISLNIQEWAREKLDIVSEGHGYLQTNCFLPMHSGTDTSPSLTIYKDHFHCFGCKGHGGLFELIKYKTNMSDADILKEYAGIEPPKKASWQDQIIQVISENSTLLRDFNNNTYFQVADKSIVGNSIVRINSKLAKFWMVEVCERFLGKKPSKVYLTYAMEYFDGKARSPGGKRANIFRRIGGDANTVWIDMGDDNYVRITADGFSVLPESDVIFDREVHQDSMKIPVNRNPKDVFKLFRVINVEDDNKKLLIIAWLVTALLSGVEYPVLLLHGVQGSGKTRAAGWLKRLIDPTGNIETLVIELTPEKLIPLVSHNTVAAFDNVSKISKEVADFLCQVVTGGTHQKRQLFTDNDLLNVDIAKTRLIIAAINKEVFETETGDLVERTIQIELSRPEGRYVEKAYLEEEFEKIRWDVLGGLFALVQGYLREGRMKHGETSEFRMTTYGAVGRYVAKALMSPIPFETAYRQDQLALSQQILDAEPLTPFMLWAADQYGEKDYSKGKGYGIEAGSLYNYLKTWKDINTQIPDWQLLPTNQRTFTARVTRMAPTLAKIHGIKIKSVDKGHKKWFWISKPVVTVGDDGEETGSGQAMFNIGEENIKEDGWSSTKENDAW